MCWMCEAYGEGTRWYLNPRNFARQLYKVKRPGQKAAAYGTDPETQAGIILRQLVESKWKDPENFQKKLDEYKAMPKEGGAQVLPLKEAMEVADMAYPIASMMCICRKALRADEETNEHEYTCTGLGVGMFKWERWPERYRGGVHFMDPDGAREWLTKMDTKGFVHMIMTFGGSYVGGICNCDYPDCQPIRQRIDYGIEDALIKGHHIAKVDYEKCVGCGICAQRCQFGAIKFEVTLEKTNIDAMKCFGCGLCETACPREAIYLVEKETIPGLREVW
ncbi:ATP-binding protein [Thermodesulfobacteriota bacterium]